MNVILCGMMGAGKTTVGRALAEKLGRKLVDTDALIEEKYGKISDIFAEYGEEYFRGLETQTAEFLSGVDGLVVSVGGGFVLRRENVAFLKTNGRIIYLRATIETLETRLQADETRPLLKNAESGLKERLQNLLNARAGIYENCADFTVDVDGKTPIRVAEEILVRIGVK